MKLILIGLLLTELDFNLNFKAFSIDVLPDFIGWILLLLGCAKMLSYGNKFRSAWTISAAMIILAGVSAVPAILGMGLLNTVLTVVNVIGSLAAIYFIVKGISDIEDALREDLGYLDIWKVFCIKIVTLVLAAVMQFIPYFGAVFIIADIVVSIIFLYRMFTVTKAYKNHFKTEE